VGTADILSALLPIRILRVIIPSLLLLLAIPSLLLLLNFLPSLLLLLAFRFGSFFFWGEIGSLIIFKIRVCAVESISSSSMVLLPLGVEGLRLDEELGLDRGSSSSNASCRWRFMMESNSSRLMAFLDVVIMEEQKKTKQREERPESPKHLLFSLEPPLQLSHFLLEV
jgi:hypothetical protein